MPRLIAALLTLVGLALLSGCPTGGDLDPGPEPEDEAEGWSEESHSNDVAANYDSVFAQGVVQRIDIEVGADNWLAMQDNLDDIVGGQGGPPDPPGPEAFAACEGLEEGDPCEYEGDDGTVGGTCLGPPQGQGPRACIDVGGTGLVDGDPIWVDVTVAHDGRTWTHVGMRWKGNSSLNSSWSAGVMKLPFRLDFDEYEDNFPETNNQRFFGFKKLTFAPGFKDPSYVRDTLMGELMRGFGLPSAATSFYEIWLDLGGGPFYAGLYTAIEDPSDAMMGTWFDDDTGNLYKPDVPCGSWACFQEDSFPLKDGEGPADHADILAAIDALEANPGDAEAWRSGLEQTFDVEGFLSWLAANTAAENWDSYGQIAHNYYLYGDPQQDGRLTWIPWDQNEGLFHWEHATVPLDLAGVGMDWPLIPLLADDAGYYAFYLDELERVLEIDEFDVDALTARAEELQELIRASVEAEEAPYTQLGSLSAFNDSIGGATGLEQHVAARREMVEALLSR